MTFKQLPNGKWKFVKNVARGKIDPNDPDYDRRLKAKFKKTEVFCDTCKTTYTLDTPCIHHLSDSPEHRARYQMLKKKEIKTVESNAQQRFK